MRRTDAGRDARQPAQRPGVPQLEHALADGDDGDDGAPARGGQPAGLDRAAQDADLPAAGVEHRRAVPALVPDEDPTGRDRGVVRMPPGRRGEGDAPLRGDGQEPVRRLGRHEEGAARGRQREVARGPGQRDAPAHAPRADVDERQGRAGRAGRVAQPDGGHVRARVDGQPLRRRADGHDASRRALGGHR